MDFRIREDTPNEQRVAVAGHTTRTIARRPIVLSALLAVVLLVVFAVQPPPSGAAASRATTTTPGVSPVTVTVPGATPPAPTATAPASNPPPASAPPAQAPAAVAPSPSPTPSAAPSAPAPPVSTGSVPAVASSTRVSSPARHRSTRARKRTAVSQRRLRSVVVRLSRCVSTLKPRSQRLMLLRAGVSGAAPRSRRAVARTLHISVAREIRLEHAALLRLQRGARAQRCGSTPAWVHVPAGNHLVLVDPALTTVTPSSTKVSFAPDAASTGSPVVPGLVFTWWRLAWTPAQQS
jgi:hypothetical protein